MSDITQKILRNVRVDLTEAYDRNFERKAFFSGAPWIPTKRPVSRGSLLLRTSKMRNSIKSEIQDESIIFNSPFPYTDIHNNGGIIKRTSTKGKNYTVNMPKRQFIGHAPEVDKIISENINDILPNEINSFINNQFNL